MSFACEGVDAPPTCLFRARWITEAMKLSRWWMRFDEGLKAGQATKRTASTLLKTEGFVFLDLTLELARLHPGRPLALVPLLC
jgi:hypothetical protein